MPQKTPLSLPVDRPPATLPDCEEEGELPPLPSCQWVDLQRFLLLALHDPSSKRYGQSPTPAPLELMGRVEYHFFITIITPPGQATAIHGLTRPKQPAPTNLHRCTASSPMSMDIHPSSIHRRTRAPLSPAWSHQFLSSMTPPGVYSNHASLLSGIRPCPSLHRYPFSPNQ